MFESTWRQLIRECMDETGEGFSDIVSSAPPIGDWLDVKFEDGYGSLKGCIFTVWTSRRVYFPVVFDGKEWCGSVSRNPDDVATPHVGGE